MAGVKRTSKVSSRPATKAKPASRPTPRKSSTPAPRSQFVKQSKPAAKLTTPAKKGVTRTLTKPKTTTAAKPTATLAKGNAPTTAKPTGTKPTTATQAAATPAKPAATTTTTTTAANTQVQDKAKPTQATTPQATAATEAPKQGETKPAGGGFLGGALGAFGFGGGDKAAADKPTTDKPGTDKPAADAKPGLIGNLFGGAKDALVNTALESAGLGDFKDIGLGDRISKLTPEQRGNLMDLAGSMKPQEGGGKQIDLKQHLGKLSTEEKGKLFDLAASGKLKTLMGELPKLQQAAEASKPSQQELQALQQISQMLGRDKLGGADGKFNYGDMDAVAQGLMRDRSGLRQQVLGKLNGEGKRFQARIANRGLNGRRGPFARKAMNQINQQVPAEVKSQLSRGLGEAQTDPQTARFRDNAPRNISFNDMKQFEQNMQQLKGMQDRLGQALGQQVIFPQGVSQEAINHTIQGALDPQADARNIDRVLQSIIHKGRVELPLPPGGVLVPRR